MRLLFDIECDNLFFKVSRMHCMVILDIDSEQKWRFRPGEDGWKAVLDKATEIIGHNIINYDLNVLWKLFKWKPKKKVKITDTLLYSQIIDYRRFGMAGHSLNAWGESLGYPKLEIDDFEIFTEFMLEYNEVDCELNRKVFLYLMEELSQTPRPEQLEKYIRYEHLAAQFSARAMAEGWPFDKAAAEDLIVRLEKELDHAYTTMNKILGSKAVAVDKALGEVPWKEPKWTKDGFYGANTAKWFNIDPCSGYEGEERMVEGPYSRVTFQKLSLNSVTDVKIFLYRNGWVPTTWNVKFDPETKKKKKTSPKITLDSLECMGENGQLYIDFLSVRSRYGVVSTWLENLDTESKLHGDMMLIGTPSMRATHSLIANVPGPEKPYGVEMRSLFKCNPDWRIIGADSKGNQVRGLAYFLGDPVFIDTLLNGDIHQYNADLLTKIVQSMGIDSVVARSQAKRILYAFLFGASGAKLWSYIFGVMNANLGNQLKEEFIKAVPGFQKLVKKLENMFERNRKGQYSFIRSIVGNKIYVDSKHKLLVYLLQATEKITCAAALGETCIRLDEHEIPYVPLIFYHDEIQFMTPDEYAEDAKMYALEGFQEGPKQFGINIMAGSSGVGLTWNDTH